MEGVAGLRLCGECDVIDRAQVEEQRRDLERARKPELAAPVHRQCGDVVLGKADAAGIRRHLPAELRDQRGLAGAIGAYHCVQFARSDIEVEIVAGDDAAEALGQPLDFQERRVHVGTLRLASLSNPSMPPRANSTTSSSIGPRMICQYSVMPERTSSNTRRATAPISGPNGEAMPPSTTMMMRSPERVQYIIAGLTYSVWFASSAPASPQSVPEMTKQTSL